MNGNKKILVLGSTGYVGTVIRDYMKLFGYDFIQVPSLRFDTKKSFWENHKDFEYVLGRQEAEFVINCLGYVGKPNVEACELNKDECYYANTFIPKILSSVCENNKNQLIHISTGCIFSGDKMFDEEDSPNFLESTYSNSKALGESLLNENDKIVRFRLPFDNADSQKNLISKIKKFDLLNPYRNSISNIIEVVHAIFDIIENIDVYKDRRIFNLVNTNPIKAIDIARLLEEYKIVDDTKVWSEMTLDKIKEVEKVPRSNCTLSTSKKCDGDYFMMDTEKSIRLCLENWNEPIEKIHTAIA